MANDAPEPDRKERLAAQLRENLRRRKAQMRARDASTPPRRPADGSAPQTTEDDASDRDET